MMISSKRINSQEPLPASKKAVTKSRNAQVSALSLRDEADHLLSYSRGDHS